MSSEGAGPQPRLHVLFARFDPEAAAVVCILLGVFQILYSSPMYYMDISQPKKLFLLPLTTGTLIVAAGSFTMACIRSPSRRLLQGCVCSNLAGLLGALLAFCLYCLSLSSIEQQQDCVFSMAYHDFISRCPGEHLMDLFWCVTVLLLLYDVGAVVLQSLLSVSAFKALKTN
ncbi:uncharacterized protein ACJ7VT_018770 isoform 1-T3 [Polymixia lowei]